MLLLSVRILRSGYIPLLPEMPLTLYSRLVQTLCKLLPQMPGIGSRHSFLTDQNAYFSGLAARFVIAVQALATDLIHGACGSLKELSMLCSCHAAEGLLIVSRFVPFLMY